MSNIANRSSAAPDVRPTERWLDIAGAQKKISFDGLCGRAGFERSMSYKQPPDTLLEETRELIAHSQRQIESLLAGLERTQAAIAGSRVQISTSQDLLRPSTPSEPDEVPKAAE